MPPEDSNTPTEPDEGQEGQPEPQQQPDAPDEGEGGQQQGEPGQQQVGETDLDKLKRIARHHESGRKDAEKATATAVAAQQAAEAKLSEATDTIAALTQAKAAAELTALKYQVGADAGLTLRQAMRLNGSTAEELAADAATLLKDFAAPTAPAGTTGAAAPPDLLEFMRRN